MRTIAIVSAFSLAVLASDPNEEPDAKRPRIAFDVVVDWNSEVFDNHDFMDPVDKLRILMQTMKQGTRELRDAIAQLEAVCDMGSFEDVVKDLFIHNKQKLSPILKMSSGIDPVGMTSSKLATSGVGQRIAQVVRAYATGLAFSPIYRELPDALRNPEYWEVTTVRYSDFIENASCDVNLASTDGGRVVTCVDRQGRLSIGDLRRRGRGLRATHLFPGGPVSGARLIPGMRVLCITDAISARLYLPDSATHSVIANGPRLTIESLTPNTAGNGFYLMFDSGVTYGLSGVVLTDPRPNLYIVQMGGVHQLFPTPIRSVDGDIGEDFSGVAVSLVPQGKRVGRYPMDKVTSYMQLTRSGKFKDITKSLIIDIFRFACEGNRGGPVELQKICDDLGNARDDEAWIAIERFIDGKPYSPVALKHLLADEFRASR